MVALAEFLDQLGVDYIEAGWPGASKDWNAFFTLIASGSGPILHHAKLTAFGSTHKANSTAKNDHLFQRLIRSPVEIVTIFGKAWKIHVTKALQTTPERNLEMIESSVHALVEAGKTVFFDAEHFFQSVREDGEAYALHALEAALRGGAKQLILCDTNGAAMYWEIETVVSRVVELFPNTIIGVHLHGDRGMSTANTVAAVRAGARHVQGTINGLSERVQMACTIEVLANLYLLQKEQRFERATISPHYAPGMSRVVSREMDHRSGVHPNPQKPFIVPTFHKAGVHASAVGRGGGDLYESHDPNTFGGKRIIALTSMAGKANVVAAAMANWDVNIEQNDSRIANILKETELREQQGCRLDICDGSASVLIAKHLWPNIPTGWEEPLRAPCLHDDGNSQIMASLIFANGVITSRIGVGPVDAVVNAVIHHYASNHSDLLNGIRLTNYYSANIERPGLEGSASLIRVEIEWAHRRFRQFTTGGVSTNDHLAAWQAIKEAFTYIFYKQWRADQTGVT
jgi:2-isopropylmalate synthase